MKRIGSAISVTKFVNDVQISVPNIMNIRSAQRNHEGHYEVFVYIRNKQERRNKPTTQLRNEC